MSNIKINLKDFKHVKSDDKSTTLRHKEGHELTLAHNSLSKPNQEALKALAAIPQQNMTPDNAGEQQSAIMADGGTVPPKPVTMTLPPKTASDLSKGMSGGINWAKGGKVKKSIVAPTAAEGIKQSNEEGPTEHGNVIETPVKEDNDIGKVKGPKGEKPQVFAEGTPDGTIEQDPSADLPGNQPDATINMPAPAAETPVADPSKAEIGQIYNTMFASQLASPNSKPMSQDNFFTPDGKPPVGNVNPEIWTAAKQKYADSQASKAKDLAESQQNANAINQANAEAGKLSPTDQQAPDQSQQPMPASTPDATPLPQRGPSSGISNDPESMVHSGYQNEAAGIKAQATAEGALGQQQSSLLDQRAKAEAEAQNAFQSSYQELEQERQNHMADIRAGYVDPNKYWTGDADGNGSHSKIATGIGMILAGFNPTNNPNAAINFLKFQMDKNIEAQGRNLGAKRSMLDANLKQFGNLHDAATMTRIMQNDVLEHQLNSEAAKAKNPLAAAAAQQATGKLQMDTAPMFQKFAVMRAMTNLANNPNGQNPDAVGSMIGYMRALDPEKAKQMEQSYVPGIGYSPTAVIPDNVRQQLVNQQKLQASGQDLLNYSKQHTNIVPGTPEYTHGVTKSMAFQQQVREGLLGTVFRESEKPLLEKFVKENPASAFKMFTTQPQLRSILESNAINFNETKKGYGLPSSQPAAQGPQFKVVNGVKYQRGPNGEAIPVK